MYHVPIRRAHQRHTRYGKVFIQLVKGCGGSCTAAADNGGSGLINHVFFACKKHPIQERGDRASGGCIVNRRTKNKTVGFCSLIKGNIYLILKNASVFSGTASAAHTAPYGVASDLKDFRVDSIFIQHAGNLRKCGVGTAFFMRASVN